MNSLFLAVIFLYLLIGQPNFMVSRKMSHSIDDETKNPSRNFDFNQLLEKKKDKNVVLIDVREQSEINETGKLPDSIHIPCKFNRNYYCVLLFKAMFNYSK